MKKLLCAFLITMSLVGCEVDITSLDGVWNVSGTSEYWVIGNDTLKSYTCNMETGIATLDYSVSCVCEDGYLIIDGDDYLIDGQGTSISLVGPDTIVIESVRDNFLSGFKIQ